MEMENMKLKQSKKPENILVSGKFFRSMKIFLKNLNIAQTKN